MHNPPAFRRFRRGTTLVEVLVVIVVFLIGILAIAQIFPGGIKILARTRNVSMAQALARAEIESLKSNPGLVPEAVLPITYVNSGFFDPQTDPTKLINAYAPSGTGISATGQVPEAGRDWQLISGANSYRRIIGETHVISSPRALTTDPTSGTAPFGSLLVVERGPIARDIGVPTDTVHVYGRDMSYRLVRETSDYVGLREYEFLVNNPTTGAAEIAFPAATAGEYRVSLTAMVNNSGNIVRRPVFRSTVVIPATPVPGYVTVPVGAIPGVLGGGETLVSVELTSVRIARRFVRIPNATAFTGNAPFTYKLLNDRIGMLLLNPVLAGRYEERAGQSRRPYVARVDYDVRDWRILHEDFRITQSSPAGLAKTIRLPISSLKTNTVAGADGRQGLSHAAVIGGSDIPNDSMEDVFVADNTTVANTNTDVADNFLAIDVATGGQIMESVAGVPSLRVDKSSGTVTFFDIDNNDANGLTQNIVMLDGTVVPTNLTGRVIRCYFMGKDEWAVQVTRNPSNYTSTLGIPGAGQFYVGGSDPTLAGVPTRIYFPRMDTNRKVSIGRIRYILGGQQAILEGAEFSVLQRPGADTIATPMPSIDIRDLVPGAIGIFADQGPTSLPYSVSNVQGVSVLVKVFFNNAKFNLTTNTAANLTSGFNQWSQQWNITTKETYLHQGESAR
ncbi:MAG: hypothetical protein QE269_11950 [Fimbriimonas sp.]|nr:hypothetical protein [Fimbriimonas sp.]